MSFSAGFAAGLAVGKKKWGNGAVVDDWQPPDWWIPVPEPEPYDIYILIQVENAGKKIELWLGNEQGYIGEGTVHYNWGDGTEEIYTFGSPPSHTYTETGQFLIHITGDENAFFFRNWNFNDQNNDSRDIVGLIIKTGSKIAFQIEKNYSYNRLFVNKSFKYIKINHSEGLPTDKTDNYFSGCQGLQKIKLAKKISGELKNRIFQGCYALKGLEQFIDCDSVTKIGEFAFSDCYRLENVEFLNCTEISQTAFYRCNNLIHAKMPVCTSVGNYGFAFCYNLQELITDENCVFGTKCFANCYSLYPRPDGGTN